MNFKQKSIIISKRNLLNKTRNEDKTDFNNSKDDNFMGNKLMIYIVSEETHLGCKVTHGHN